jgi:cell division transport system permease protein
MLDKIWFLLGEALVAMRRNYTMTFASISTSAVALFLLGGLAYVYIGLNNLSADATGKFEMRVYLQDGAKPETISQVAGSMRALSGVRAVAWIPKDKAWLKEKEKYPASITEGLANPLPDAFKVTLADLSKADSVVDGILKIPGVDTKRGVEYLKAEQQFVEQMRSLVQWLGSALGALLLLTSGVLIYNAIRLTVLSRRLEVRIMQLVGASRLTIRVPYLIEGVIHGTMGGIFATTLLLACQRALESRLHHLSALDTLPPFPFLAFLQILVAAGASYGFGCSYLALTMSQKGA